MQLVSMEKCENLRFDQRPGIWIRLLVECRQLGAQDDGWEEQEDTEDNSSPESILKLNQNVEISRFFL